MAKKLAPKAKPFRFAHPFVTTTPIDKRAPVPGIGNRMLDYIKGKLQKIPPVKGNAVMKLADVIGSSGAQAIEESRMIRFHAVGDTGRSQDSPQGDVANAMAKDYDAAHPESSPAFFFHLGDVIYGHDKDASYRREFYEPYTHYPGKIIAIPGNHDGEVFPKTDPVSLQAFNANFCAPSQVVPKIAGTIFRQTMNQPGVYWRLDAPFVDIVAMYSNAAENPGFISGGAAGTAQKTWLKSTLSAIKNERSAQRKALIFATHHPPYTSDGHSPSHQMLADIDQVCAQVGIMPDLFLSGHSHNYQHHTRHVTISGKRVDIPFIVAGCGGINDGAVPKATGKSTPDQPPGTFSHTFEKSNKGYGYLLIEVGPPSITVTMFAVAGTTKSQFERFLVPLS